MKSKSITNQTCSSFFISPKFKWLTILLAIAALIVIFHDGLEKLVGAWTRAEYSHGYIIPVVSIYLILQRRQEIQKTLSDGSWLGVLFVFGGLIISLMGEYATLYIVIQYGLLITLFGSILSFLGWRGICLIWAPLLYLAFVIPLPSFLYNNLSAEMQLLSSSLGVWFVRIMGISVYLSGNVIDLGTYKLQVIEACSGLRYLFPLMSFGFLFGYLYVGPIWQKVALFASTFPITLVMNSIRIAVIAITVERWGNSMAEGILHYTEGWLVFMICVAILFVESWSLNYIFGNYRPIHSAFQLSLKRVRRYHNGVACRNLPKPFFVSVCILLIATPSTIVLKEREEPLLERRTFDTFPMTLNEWRGHRISIDKKIQDVLGFDDFILANYWQKENSIPVNFYVAYYASQRKGQSAHSPQSCIPGDGWEIENLSEKLIDSVVSSGVYLKVNRVKIKKGDITQLVYYWFEQRNRTLTNEYVLKWYLFWDGLTRNRTDGALVRVVTFVSKEGAIQEADKRLTNFVQTVYPLLISKYLPK